MKITALEVRSHPLNKTLRGYDTKEVESLKELAAEALEEAAREISTLESRLKDATRQLSEHVDRETMLKNTITTAHKMAEDLKNNAKKEAELILTEARLKAEDLIRQAHDRSRDLQQEIYRLKKQRLDVQTSIKAILDYHASRLRLEEEESLDEAPEITPLPEK